MCFIDTVFFKIVHMHYQTAASPNINRLSECKSFCSTQKLVTTFFGIKHSVWPSKSSSSTIHWWRYLFQGTAPELSLIKPVPPPGWPGIIAPQRYRHPPLSWQGHEIPDQLVPEGMNTLSSLQGGCKEFHQVPPLLLSMWILALR